MRKMNKKAFVMSGVVALTFAAFGFASAATSSAPSAEEALAFSQDNWTITDDALVSDNGYTYTTDKDCGPTLISTTREYKDFHLRYNVQYIGCADGVSPWQGSGGIIINGDKDANAPNGYYLGLYSWYFNNDCPNNLWLSTGYWHENRSGAAEFNLLNGVDAAFGNTGFNRFTVDIVVKDSMINLKINDWLVQCAPLPYSEGGVISIYSDGVACSYSDFNIELLDADYDISSTLVRANWNGFNVAGEIDYWNDAEKDQTFKMRLPDEHDENTEYYLARVSKTKDSNQSVDVYVDVNGTLTFEDKNGWASIGKALTWGDAQPGTGDFGMNVTEVPKSAFMGATAGERVGFYLDKNIDGWYSATSYWLLYKDKSGVMRVADYLDLTYTFDRNDHGFACDTPNSYYKNYQFISTDSSLITSHFRGQEVNWLKLPTIEKTGDIEHDFKYTDTDLEVDVSDFVDIQTNHYKCNIDYSIDGGEFTQKLILPAQTAQGKITVRLSPAGVRNDNSGTVTFAAKTVELDYSTVLEEAPSKYFYATKHITVNSVGDGTAIDLKDYINTNLEGEWSYEFDGKTEQGSKFVIPARSVSDGTITVYLTPEDGEKMSADIAVDVEYFVYPETVEFPYYMTDGVVGNEWMPLYGTVNTVNGKWVSDKQHEWGVMADFGTDNYTFRTRIDVKEDEKITHDYGVLLHASVGMHGYNGLLIQLFNRGNSPYFMVGWLNDGDYIPLYGEFYSGFGTTGDFYFTVVSSGSAVEVMLNGWRIFEVADRYFGGGKIAILGGGAKGVYYDMQCDAFVDNIADKVIRKDFTAPGCDTYAKESVWSNEFNVDFALPDADNVTDFKLVARTFLNGKKPTVSVGDKTFDWQIPSVGDYADIALELDGLSPNGDKLTVTVTPDENKFDAAFMTLTYKIGETEYIADSVYFANKADADAHNTIAGTINDRKMFVAQLSPLLLTARRGEQAVYMRCTTVSDRMTAETYTDSAISSVVDLPYRLYLPDGYDESRQYPVLLFMHGAGERGNDNTLQTNSVGNTTNVLLDRAVFGGYNDRFIVVAPQCPIENDMRWVDKNLGDGNYSFDNVTQSVPSRLVQSLLYNEIFKKYAVDLSRIYGVGLSMGGGGITDLAMRNPDLFAAIVNVAGWCDPNKADLFATTAIRGYHSPTDNVVDYNSVKDLLAACEAKGYDAKYFEINVNIGHAEWVTAFEEPDILSWLLAHHKIWTLNTVLNGGTLGAADTLPETFGFNDKITLPTPVRAGYVFGGWYGSAEFNGDPITTVNGDNARNVEVYARWIREVTVTVKSNDAVIESLTLNNGDTVDLSKYAPVNDGHILVGWTDGEKNYSPNGIVTVEDDITLIAIWEKAQTPVDPTPPITPTPDDGNGNNPSESPTDDGNDNGVNLGLAVGLPVGLVGAAALGAGAFMIVRKKRKGGGNPNNGEKEDKE